ncbi:nuclear transport factor 2 family protein [Streptomyces sp. TLI_171]|uniref:nuclear transport factor 2 family protein n=1 Tax=Streptomyces sp. TLI_171 TaxID=1938859 RepID=UPI00160084BA|nr:nuclear transport factor 2 family protein [Streptomyces sp. TLI_171]
MLDLMDLADYHPLRVLLRDGSGAQSLAARALPRSVRAAATALTSSLERDGRTLVELLARAVPGTVPVVAGTPAELGYVRSLRLLSKRCQEFLFQHYLLVLEVLGADNTGSLGYAVATMAHRAAQPLVPELNRALHDFAKATDLQHATRAGVMILENERRAGWDPAPPEPGEQMQTEWADEVVASYFAALADRDTERWTELFHPAGHLVGQSGTRPFIGRPRLKVFMDSMLCQFTALQPEVTTVVRTGPASFRAVWSISAVHYTGPEVTLRGAEELLLAADGLIVSAISDWNAAQVAAQLWPGAPAMPSPNPASFDGQRQSNGPAERWDAAVA